MQTLESISKRYAVNSYNESYYTVELTDLMTGTSESFMVFGSLESIVYIMDATIFSTFGDDADPAQYRAVISYGKTELVVMPTCAGPDNAIIVFKPAREAYEIRQVDALAYDDGWSYNETYRIGSFATASQDVPRAFRHALARLGISFYPGRTVTEYDGDVYEICDRATREPLFVAIPEEA